ncbi:hypothetical protein, partial [Streptobacillus moniliformis]|uniref:hypothetical protein n=1 Tax=Streptobacillus moniliformis TaxID=34105 RepID=UPI000AB938EA
HLLLNIFEYIFRKNFSQIYNISVVVFEKSKLMVCNEIIESLISKRYDNTNVNTNSVSIVQTINNQF